MYLIYHYLYNSTNDMKIEYKLNVYWKNVNNRFFPCKNLFVRVEDKLMFLLRIQLKVFDVTYYYEK